jgi:hypothetical protein
MYKKGELRIEMVPSTPCHGIQWSMSKRARPCCHVNTKFVHAYNRTLTPMKIMLGHMTLVQQSRLQEHKLSTLLPIFDLYQLHRSYLICNLHGNEKYCSKTASEYPRPTIVKVQYCKLTNWVEEFITINSEKNWSTNKQGKNSKCRLQVSLCRSKTYASTH